MVKPAITEEGPYAGRVQDHGRPRSLNYYQTRECAKMRKEGMTYDELGKYFNVSASVVFRAVKALQEGRA
jgi:hypothetical protein